MRPPAVPRSADRPAQVVLGGRPGRGVGDPRPVAGRVDVGRLITDVVDAPEVASAFERLDRGDPETLQVVLRFPAAPEPAP